MAKGGLGDLFLGHWAEVRADLRRGRIAQVSRTRPTPYDVNVVLILSPELAVHRLSLADVGVMGIYEKGSEPDQAAFADLGPPAGGVDVTQGRPVIGQVRSLPNETPACSAARCKRAKLLKVRSTGSPLTQKLFFALFCA